MQHTIVDYPEGWTPDGWMPTFTGGVVWPLQACGMFHLSDIAHSLACTARWRGHTREFYSVAQHAVIASRIGHPDHLRWLLMHDAAEAYIGDIPASLKPGMFVSGLSVPTMSVDVVEERLLKLVANVFGLPWPPPNHEIERVDHLLRCAETRDLVSWPENLPNPYFDPVGIERIYPVCPQVAERMFLDRAAELGFEQA